MANDDIVFLQQTNNMKSLLHFIFNFPSSSIYSFAVGNRQLRTIWHIVELSSGHLHTWPLFRAKLNWAKNKSVEEVILFSLFMRTNCPSWMIQQEETQTVDLSPGCENVQNCKNHLGLSDESSWWQTLHLTCCDETDKSCQGWVTALNVNVAGVKKGKNK